jgi:hypothetical protein
MENDLQEPLRTWTPCVAVNGIEYYNHEAIPAWQNSVLLSVLGGLGGQYERLSVLHLSEDGLSVTSEDQYFSEFGQRVRDIAVNPTTGAVYVAFNGPSYPGSGPNIIKEFVNTDYIDGVPETAEAKVLAVYPNPVADVLQVDCSSSLLGATIEILSFTGKNMGTWLVERDSMDIPVSGWASGSYFLRLQDGKGTLTRTFTVAH